MRDSEIIAMLKNDCPMCGPADCACTATEQDQYREIQRLRLTDAERKAIGWAIMECESMPTTMSREAADTLRALLKRLG
jgi:hypothetical protein